VEERGENFEIKVVKKVEKEKNVMMLNKTPLDSFQECYDKYKKKIMKEIVVKTEELPLNDIGYGLTPSMDKLS
jgi:hypothetical protein